VAGWCRRPPSADQLHTHAVEIILPPPAHTKEPLWHLCNEPFDYTKVSEKKLSIPAKPTTRVLNQHYPNAKQSAIGHRVQRPERGWALVEILDQSGNNLEVISNAICEAGYHMAAWNTAKYASGSYKYRLRYNGYNEVHDLS
jgi:hypothetical protein